MIDTAEQDEPVAPSEVSAALEWNRVEENRRLRRRQVARLKARQRTVDINEWAGRNSRSAKLQVAVKKGLRDWFEAARNGSGGVPCGVLIDAVITLGLSHDLKQVKRTVIGAADPSNGQLRTFKIFSAALLACCCSDLSRDRLFRSLREEEDWRLLGTYGGGKEASPEVAASVNGTPSSAMPAFVTQLTAYRRKAAAVTLRNCNVGETPDPLGRLQLRHLFVVFKTMTEMPTWKFHHLKIFLAKLLGLPQWKRKSDTESFRKPSSGLRPAVNCST
ncbi:unnamed protein product [Scytosiphon promiscuus]